MHVVQDETDQCPEADVIWQGAFIDGDPELLRFTATAPNGGAQIYVELMEIEI